MEVKEILKELEKYSLPSIVMETKPAKAEEVSLFVSKFGGYPYLPKEGSVPVGEDGERLFFLAQIDCEELSENDIYHKKGMMQFYIGSDDLFGCDFDDELGGESHKVVYYEQIDKGVGLDEVKGKYSFEEYEYTPFSNNAGCFTLTFREEKQLPDSSDGRFDAIFNGIFGEYCIEDEVYDELIDELYGEKHRIGGYAAFTQEDPREKKNVKMVRYCCFKW